MGLRRKCVGLNNSERFRTALNSQKRQSYNCTITHGTLFIAAFKPGPFMPSGQQTDPAIILLRGSAQLRQTNKHSVHVLCVGQYILHFYRASICECGLGSRNSVRPSVRLPRAWIVTKLNDALQIF